MQTDTGAGGQDVRQKAEETASVVAEQAQQAATQRISSQKERAASTLDTVAQTLRQSGDNLRDEQPQIASLTDQAARRVEDVSTYVRQHDVRDFVSEAERFARREPVMFLGGALAIGFVAARFLKASSPTSDQGGGTGFVSGTTPRYGGYDWTTERGLGGDIGGGYGAGAGIGAGIAAGESLGATGGTEIGTRDYGTGSDYVDVDAVGAGVGGSANFSGTGDYAEYDTTGVIDTTETAGVIDSPETDIGAQDELTASDTENR